MNVVFSCFQISVVFSTSLIQFTLQTAQFASLVYIGVLAIVVSHGISQSSAAPVDSVSRVGRVAWQLAVQAALGWAWRMSLPLNIHSKPNREVTKIEMGKTARNFDIAKQRTLSTECFSFISPFIFEKFSPHKQLHHHRNKLVGILLRLVCSLQMRQ